MNSPHSECVGLSDLQRWPARRCEGEGWVELLDAQTTPALWASIPPVPVIGKDHPNQ